MLKLAGEIQNKNAAAIALQRLGIVYHDNGNDKAEEFYSDSLALKEELNDLEGQAQICSQLGSLYTKKGRLPEALIVLERGLNLLEKTSAPEWEKLCLYGNLGHLYGEQKDWIKAIQFTNKVCQVAEEMDMPYELASGTYDIGVHEARQGNQEEASKHYLKALEIAKKYKLWQFGELVQLALGKQNQELGNYDKAISYFEKVIEIEEQVDDKPRLAATSFDIGSFYYQKNDFKKAFDFYEKGITLFEHLVNEEQVRIFLSNILVLAQKPTETYRLLQALKLLKDRLLNKATSYALAKVYRTLGEIYLKLLKKPRIAIACVKQEITLLAQLNRSKEQAESLIYLGSIREDLEHYEPAISSYTDAIRQAEISKLSNLACIAYYNRANCFTQIKMWNQAENDYCHALEILKLEELDEVDLQEAIIHNYGEMSRRCGEFEKAVELLNLSLDSAKRRCKIDDEILSLNNLGLAYWKSEQNKKAINCFNNALELSRQHYRKHDEARVLISLGNVYLVNEQPDKAKCYYENALASARIVEDIKLEEDRMLSLAYAHQDLGTFESIAEDFKLIAERASTLNHWENLTKFLILDGTINLESKNSC